MSKEIDFNSALKRPFQDGTKLIIGCVLNIVPIVNFLSTGYILESTKMSLKGNNKLPEWDNWGDLFVKGLLASIISLIWMIPALILAAIGGGAMIASALTGMAGGTVPSMAGMAGSFGLFAIAGLLALVTAYFLPAAILNYISKDNFGDGFDFSTVFKKALNGQYFVAWILALVVGVVLSMVGGIIGGIFSFMPLVGSVLMRVIMASVLFISMMVAFTLIAPVWKKA